MAWKPLRNENSNLISEEDFAALGDRFNARRDRSGVLGTQGFASRGAQQLYNDDPIERSRDAIMKKAWQDARARGEQVTADDFRYQQERIGREQRQRDKNINEYDLTDAEKAMGFNEQMGLAQEDIDQWGGYANRALGMADQARGDQFASRGNALNALAMQQAAAEGRAPSVAENQMRAGLDQSQRQALGLAASGRGNAAANMRNAMQQGAVAAGQANQQAGMLRAGEMAQARNAYSDASRSLRGQDMAREGQFESAYSAGLGNVTQGRGQQMQTYGQRLGAAQAERNARMNFQDPAKQSKFDRTMGQIGQVTNMVGQLGGAAAGAAALSDIRAKQNIQPAAGAQQALLGDLQGAFEAGKLEMAMRGAKTPQLDAMGRLGAAPRVDTSAFDNMKTPTLDALGASPAGAESMMRSVKPAKYNYKPESGWDDGRTHIGVMAQDLEKDPIGRQFVTEREDGAKMVDYQAMAPLLLANQAMLQKKVDTLKKGKK